nr:MAG TPA: hyaluronidase [Caudoviricetes sp.]
MAFPKLLQKLFQNNGAGDKLNQDIIPDIPYSKVTDAPSVDSALSSTSENPVQNKVINSALDGKLSTSGGTMTGDISFTGNRKIKNATNKGGELVIDTTGSALHGSNVDWQDGASLLLRSSAYPNDQKGCFFLLASLSSSQKCMLVGAPDGSLTWCGKSLTGGLTVVAESYSANSWYRKYSDGWIEQGIKIETNPGSAQAFTLATPFSTTNYTIAVSQNGEASRSISRAAIAAITRSSVTVHIDSSAMLPVRVYMCGK